MKRVTLAAMLLVASVGPGAWAQPAVDTEAQQTDQMQPKSGMSRSPGMMGGGMMGGGMMGGGMTGGGMMRGNMPSSHMMPMMMERMGAGGGCKGMNGMAGGGHVEGWIAFIRAELKITDAQRAAFDAFADALRSNAQTMGELRQSMMSQGGVASQSVLDRLDLQERFLSVRLQSIRALKSPLANLVGRLSEEQKKAADEILMPGMGMGAMCMGAGMQTPQTSPD